MKKIHFLNYLLLLIFSLFLTSSSCKKEKSPEPVLGYEFLNKIPGLWHGPVTSSTSAGSFDFWYLDFRPVSASQVSQYSILDTNTSNSVSFFIVRHNNQLKVAMRTLGCFMDTCCVTYEVMDSVAESGNYYRFSDFVRGKQRAYSEFIINGDQMQMNVYTNKFNSSPSLLWHTTWNAVLGSRSNAEQAIAHFGFPKPEMVRDFSSAFTNMTESMFFPHNYQFDPYPSSSQPYRGNVTVNISVSPSLTVNPNDIVFVVFTTQTLFSGIQYIPDNLKYVSNFLFLSAGTHSYVIPDVHPGTYYLYALIDKNHDHNYMSGDYATSNVTYTFTVNENQNTNVTATIDYILP